MQLLTPHLQFEYQIFKPTWIFWKLKEYMLQVVLSDSEN